MTYPAPMSALRRVPTILLVAVALIALMGCSGESDAPPVAEETPSVSPPATPSPTPTPPAEDESAALRTAVTAYSDAFLTGDADAAFAMLSKRCQDRVGAETFAGIVAQAEQTYGSPLELESFEAQISGDLARASYTYAVSAIDQDQEPWVREAGEWREDDC